MRFIKRLQRRVKLIWQKKITILAILDIIFQTELLEEYNVRQDTDDLVCKIQGEAFPINTYAKILRGF